MLQFTSSFCDWHRLTLSMIKYWFIQFVCMCLCRIFCRYTYLYMCRLKIVEQNKYQNKKTKKKRHKFKQKKNVQKTRSVRWWLCCYCCCSIDDWRVWFRLVSGSLCFAVHLICCYFFFSKYRETTIFTRLDIEKFKYFLFIFLSFFCNSHFEFSYVWLERVV